MAVLDISPLLHETLAGRYVLKREIGRGGAATVYLAHDVRHERLVAIKVLHHELSHALGAQRFLREIKLTASLQHPHILPIHDSGEAHDQLYYVMPYVEGDSMRQRLTADNRLSIEETVRIGREVAGALAYAHERGVVHRDIKPENILFSGGHAVLADFGIARAINRAHEKITQQGTITGTPAYMSPEQARDRAFDGRSDVYSLACVLYEAIAGVPPFVGDTPQQLLTQRISKRAPLLREYRHDVPAPIESVLAKALSISPDDRFDDVRAFSAALSAAIGNSGETLAARAIRRPLSKSPWLWAAGVALLLSGSAVSTDMGRDQIDVLTGRVDTAQYAVFPFQYVGSAAPGQDQEPVAEGLYTAMREWNGLKLTSDLSVSDVRRSLMDSSLKGMMTAARRARAGKLVWGRVLMSRDSIKVRAGIYDAITGVSLRERAIAGSRDLLETHPGVLRVLAAELLRLEGAPASANSGDVGTRSFAAWRAYEEGQRALTTWRVLPAIESFERAVAADPEYAHAQTWLAQLLVWRGEPSTRWNSHVSTALRNRAALGARESSLVDALQSIQRGNFSEACTAYNAIRSRDSLDAAAWLGLAHCQGLDNAVVRNSSSKTGWIFRGSMAGAQRAYARALQISPSAFCAFPFEVVTRLFVVETNIYRHGAAADSSGYFGLQDIVGDTIAYAARPFAELNAAPYEVVSPAYDRALKRNRDALLGILSALTQRLPDNADAFESLARVLETRDDITGTPNGGYSALSALDRAKLLAKDSAQRARLGATDVRLHLKLGDFSRTVAIGDSVLSANPSPSPRAAQYLAGIASLLGRERIATQHFRSSGFSVSMAGSPAVPLLEDVSTALFMRAAFGVCDDSLRVLYTRMGVLLESYVNQSQRGSARRGMLMRPAQFSVGCLGPASTIELGDSVSSIMRAVQALGASDAKRSRFLLDSLQNWRKMLRPGEISLDHTLTEAWLAATLGDTAGATRQLDLTLTALPTLSSYVVFEPGMAAAVGRSMVYRAELASARGDAVTAALWAGRVLTLWSHSDPSLAPTLARMKSLASHRT
ncbi:MAG: serine/threonine-protein kinase [Gemmatimonadaceae bacterium]